MWDLQTGARLHELTGHQDWVNSVALSGDGRYIVSGSGDRTVAVWDLQTGARLHELTGHQGGVTSVALSGDGRHIVSGSRDGTVAVWDLQTGARLHELTGHQGWVSSVALSGDGRYIVSGSGDRTVAVWDLQTGARLHELTGHHGVGDFRGLERRRAAHRLGLRRWDGGGVGPPDRCTARYPRSRWRDRVPEMASGGPLPGRGRLGRKSLLSGVSPGVSPWTGLQNGFQRPAPSDMRWPVAISSRKNP